MRRRVLLLIIGSVLAVSFATPASRPDTAAGAEALPSKLSDAEFWRIIEDFSEPNGTFRSDNLLSNEVFLQHVIPDLVRTAKHERVYLGVGPEQNFTYISAIRPRLAFIVDVRRGKGCKRREHYVEGFLWGKDRHCDDCDRPEHRVWRPADSW